MKNNTNNAVSAEMEKVQKEVERLKEEQRKAAEKLSWQDIAFALNSLVDFWKPENYRDY